MDVKSILSNLEHAATNNDRKSFMDIIFNLPVEIIITLTEMDLKAINQFSKQIDFLKVPEFGKFLREEGLYYYNKILDDNSDISSNLLAIFYLDICVSLYEKYNKQSPEILILLGHAHNLLAAAGIDYQINLENAIELYVKAHCIISPINSEYTVALLDEANSRIKLADIGINPKTNLEIAIELCIGTQSILSAEDPDYPITLLYKANSRLKLAQIGVNPQNNLESAIELYIDIQKIVPATSPDYAGSLLNEANARHELAEIGVNPQSNLETAIELCVKARNIFSATSPDYAGALMNEARARQYLAKIGINPQTNFETAIELCVKARNVFSATSPDYARSLVNEASSRLDLVEIGVNPQISLETAIELLVEAQNIFLATSPDYARALSNEANARQNLAKIGINPQINLETAIELCVKARNIFSATSPDYARALVNEASTRLNLAEIGVNHYINLETAIKLLVEAQNILPTTSRDYAGALMNEASAKQKLAEIGINPQMNLENAIGLCLEAQSVFSGASPGYAIALMKEANARRRLAEICIDPQINILKSEKLYLESISILDNLTDRWAYSVALLNLNMLLIKNFYISGNRDFLEKGKQILETAEEKIITRDVRHKEILLANLCEFKARLLEFEGIQGKEQASREYMKAFELTHNPYYRLMDQFNQAFLGNETFCDIVNQWKGQEKSEIMLSYYDYCIFECHLENALKNTINEEDELNTAVSKLKEIRDRTQIKALKDRVSAYVYLMQALVDCFSAENYLDAKRKIKAGCDIFKENMDRQGQEICIIFSDAIIRNRDPDAWQNIIRQLVKNRQLSSNFSSLLGEYADRKRSNLESARLATIHTTVQEINKKIDQIIVYVKPGVEKEIVISGGIDLYGNAVQYVVHIPDEIAKEYKDKLMGLIKERKPKLRDFPQKVASFIIDYLKNIHREDLIESLS